MSPPRKLFLADAIPFFICACLILTCILVSHSKWLWFDEILTVYPATMRSFWQIWSVCQEPMNTAPPLYFYLVWFYTRLFGASPVALRLLSCIPICLAVLLLWKLLRKYMSIMAVTIAMLGALSSHILTWQNNEARFYGLYFFLGALLFYVFAEINTKRQESTTFLVSLKQGSIVCLVCLLFIFTHTVGILFVVSLLLCQLLIDWNTWHKTDRTFFQAFKLDVYMGSTVAFVLFVIIWLPTSIAQLHAFHGMSNAHPATVVSLLNDLFEYSLVRKLFNCAPMLTVLGVMIANGNRIFFALVPHTDSPRVTFTPVEKILILGLGYQLVAPLLTYGASILGTSLLLQRYLIPHWIGWIVLCAWVVDQSLKRTRVGNRSFVYATCAVFTLVYITQFVRKAHTLLREGDIRTANYARLTAAIRAHPDLIPANYQLPTLHSHALLFLSEYYYHKEIKPFYLLSDSLQGQHPEYVNMVATHKNFPSIPILEKSHMDDYDDFILYDTQEISMAQNYFAKIDTYKLEPVCVVAQFGSDGRRSESNTMHVYRVQRKSTTLD